MLHQTERRKMNPAQLALLIPILALSIPIVAIFASIFKKRGMVNPAQEKKIRELEAKVASLEQTVSVLADTVLQIEDKQTFLNKLLEDR